MRKSVNNPYWLFFTLLGITIVIVGCAGKEPIKVEKSPTPSLTKNISTPTKTPTLTPTPTPIETPIQTPTPNQTPKQDCYILNLIPASSVDTSEKKWRYIVRDNFSKGEIVYLYVEVGCSIKGKTEFDDEIYVKDPNGKTVYQRSGEIRYPYSTGYLRYFSFKPKLNWKDGEYEITYKTLNLITGEKIMRKVKFDLYTPIGYSIVKAASIGRTVEFNFSISGNEYHAKATVLEVKRGSSALGLVKSVSQYNPDPGDGYEYLAVKIRFELLNGAKAYRISQNYFTVYVNGVGYDYAWEVNSPRPELNGKLIPPSKIEGWIVFEIPENSKPVLSFNDLIWFKLF